MVLLQDALEEKKFDARNLDRAMARNILNADEVAKLIKQLPDDGANADWMNIESLHQDKTN